MRLFSLSVLTSLSEGLHHSEEHATHFQGKLTPALERIRESINEQFASLRASFAKPVKGDGIDILESNTTDVAAVEKPRNGNITVYR